MNNYLRPLIGSTCFLMSVALLPVLLNSLAIVWDQGASGVAVFLVLTVAFVTWQWNLTLAMVSLMGHCKSGAKRFMKRFWS